MVSKKNREYLNLIRLGALRKHGLGLVQTTDKNTDEEVTVLAVWYKDGDDTICVPVARMLNDSDVEQLRNPAEAH